MKINKQILKYLIFIPLFVCVSCSTPYKHLSKAKLNFEDGGFTNYYVLAGTNKKKGEKLIIYLNGSGVTSALGEKGSFWWKSITPAYDLRQQTASNIDILIPEYRNVKAGMSHKNDRRAYEHYTLEGRVSSAVSVIDHFLKNSHYQSVYMIGHSEGALILPRVYRELQSQKQINRLVLMSYGGLSQFENFRIMVDKHGFPDNTYLANLKNLDETIKNIQQDPLSLDKWWLGSPYRRWSSFGPYKPLEDLLKIDIPIMLTHGSEDMYAPVESSRLVKNEFQKAGKMNITYKEYKNNGHAYLNGDFNQVFKDINAWFSAK